MYIEDVERGAELTFSGSGPPSASSSNFSPKCFGFFGFRQDRRTDRRNKYVMGLPCFKKLSSGFKNVRCVPFDEELYTPSYSTQYTDKPVDVFTLPKGIMRCVFVVFPVG